MGESADISVLNSWKEIAEYLDRDVRTCYRWHKELGLPVYRINSTSSRSRVFAYKSEIDHWLKDKAEINELTPKRIQALRWLALGGLSAGLVLAAVVFLIEGRGFRHASQLSVGVSMFRSRISPGRDDYLSSGLTRAIVDGLESAGGLRIILTDSFQKLSAVSKTLKDLLAKQGADYVLNGELEQGNKSTTIAVELVRLSDGLITWTSRYDEPVSAVPSIPKRICNDIRKALGLKTDVPNTDGFGRGDYRAIDDYFKGSFILTRLNQGNDNAWQFYDRGIYYAGGFTLESNEMAITMFLRALETDPKFAKAIVGLAACYANYVNFNWRYDISWLRKAESLLEKARAMEPDIPEYYSTLIGVEILKEKEFSDSTPGLLRILVEEGTKRYPFHARINSIAGYYHYMLFGKTGNPDEFRWAQECKASAYELNPFDLGNIVYANLLMLDGKFEEAANVCGALESLDDSSMAKYLAGEISYYGGKLDKSQAIFESLSNVTLEYKIGALCYLAMISARRGEKSKARAILKEVENIGPDKYTYFERELKTASVWAGIGEERHALAILKTFFSDPKCRKEIHIYRKYIEIDDNFASLRNQDSYKNFFEYGGQSWQKARLFGLRPIS